MKVVTHEDFKQVYTRDPAAAAGRIESILSALGDGVEFEEASPANRGDIAAVHTERHIQKVARRGLYDIAALAAGATIQAARAGLTEPCFALVRPPGHHASADSYWGFCYFNNLAIAIDHLKRRQGITTAYVLDFDLHYGDGTVSIMAAKGYVTIHNPVSPDRGEYLEELAHGLAATRADMIAVSAGFDNHIQDWGGVLLTEDFETIGRLVREACRRLGAGCFAVLEGGYNHRVLGESVVAFLRGLSGR
jgi:acetoin utilization deacetylase AcuC-like enzyme